MEDHPELIASPFLHAYFIAFHSQARLRVKSVLAEFWRDMTMDAAPNPIAAYYHLLDVLETIKQPRFRSRAALTTRPLIVQVMTGLFFLSCKYMIRTDSN